MSNRIFSKFNDLQENALHQLPVQLRSLSLNAAQKINEGGLPDRRSEEWKYTNLDFISQFNGQLVKAPSMGRSFLELNDRELQELCGLREKLNDWLKDSAIENLNMALTTSGSYVNVKKGEKQFVEYNITSSHVPGWLSPRAALFVQENAELTVVEVSELSEGELQNSVVDVNLAEGAKLNYIRIQNNNRGSNHISSIRVIQEKNSQFEYFNFSLGSDIARDNVYSLLQGAEARCNLKGLSVARPSQHLDQYAFVDHATPGAHSEQIFKTIISNNARAVFNGRVMVRKGSVGTEARQLNKNLLLGKTSEVDTRPQLEIYNDDVKCGHGATIGRLNPDELFYLESRAIPKKLATNMLCKAFVDELIDLVGVEAAQANLRKLIDRYFAELESDYDR